MREIYRGKHKKRVIIVLCISIKCREMCVLHVAVGHNARLVSLGHALVEKHMFTIHHAGGSSGAVCVCAPLHGAGPVRMQDAVQRYEYKISVKTYMAELIKVQYMLRFDCAQMQTELRRCYLYIARPPKQLSSFVREEICIFSIKARTLRFDTCNVE